MRKAPDPDQITPSNRGVAYSGRRAGLEVTWAWHYRGGCRGRRKRRVTAGRAVRVAHQKWCPCEQTRLGDPHPRLHAHRATDPSTKRRVGSACRLVTVPGIQVDRPSGWGRLLLAVGAWPGWAVASCRSHGLRCSRLSTVGTTSFLLEVRLSCVSNTRTPVATPHGSWPLAVRPSRPAVATNFSVIRSRHSRRPCYFVSDVPSLRVAPSIRRRRTANQWWPW